MPPSTSRFAVQGKRKPAQVILFPVDTAQKTRRFVGGTTDEYGRILLYTGVRYERPEPAAIEVQAPHRRRS